MVVHCELYLCNINSIDILVEIHLIWISHSTEYSNYMSYCQYRNDLGLNPQPSSNESNALPLSYLDWQIALIIFQALAKSKQLMRHNDKSILHEVNTRECDTLEEFWQGEECMNAVMKFFSEK